MSDKWSGSMKPHPPPTPRTAGELALLALLSSCDICQKGVPAGYDKCPACGAPK